eukprot:7264554-Prymnesium_polylepis.1
MLAHYLRSLERRRLRLWPATLNNSPFLCHIRWTQWQHSPTARSDSFAARDFGAPSSGANTPESQARRRA